MTYYPATKSKRLGVVNFVSQQGFSSFLPAFNLVEKEVNAKAAWCGVDSVKNDPFLWVIVSKKGNDFIEVNPSEMLMQLMERAGECFYTFLSYLGDMATRDRLQGYTEAAIMQNLNARFFARIEELEEGGNL